MSDVSDKHAASQGRNCAGVVANVLAETLMKGRPADRALSSAFYEHHEYGSRDRRLISETLFSVLRWWGWLRHVAPVSFVKAWESHDSEASLSFPLQDFFPLFSAAWFLEGKNELPAAANWWLQESGVDRKQIQFISQESSILERKRYLRPFLSSSVYGALKNDDLLPSWCYDFISLPVERDELLEWAQMRPPVWIRVDTEDENALYEELSENNIRVRRHPLMRNAWQIEFSGANLRGMPGFRSGKFEIQDIASQVVGYVCSPKPGQQWWDACAGGGGKTLHLASLMKRRGSVLATDIRVYKLEDLKLRARRAQFPNIRYKEWKGKDMPTFKGHFDGVLLDTACSCSGTWRRNPAARWTTGPEEIQEFHELQSQLLENASRGVKNGGTLVYSTCSMFGYENRDVVMEFLERHKEFSLVPFQCPITGEDRDGMNQIWPWDSDCDAMFTAKMVRHKN